MNSLSAIGVFRRNIPLLSPNPEVSYENVFRMYSTENSDQQNFLYFNLLNSVYLPPELDANVYYTITVNRIMPWTAISYNEYRSIDLWWLIMLANNINNPIDYPAPGTQLRVIKKDYLPVIMDTIITQLKSA